MPRIVERRVNGLREMYLGDRYKWLGNEVRGIYDVDLLRLSPPTPPPPSFHPNLRPFDVCKSERESFSNS